MSLRMRRKMMKPPATSGRPIPFYSDFEPNGEEFVTGFPYEDLDFNTDKTLFGKFTITDITKSKQTLLIYSPYKPSPTNFILSGSKYGAQWALMYGSERKLYITIDYRQSTNPETGESSAYSLRTSKFITNVDPLVNGDVIKFAWNKNGFYCNGEKVSFEPPLNEYITYADFMNMVCSAGNRTDGQGYFGVYNNASKNIGKSNQKIDELTLYPKLLTDEQMAELTYVPHREITLPEYDANTYPHRSLLYGVAASSDMHGEYADKPCFSFTVDSEQFPEFVRGGIPNAWIWKITGGGGQFKKGIGKRWLSNDGKKWDLITDQDPAFFISSGLNTYYHKYEDSILKNDFLPPQDYNYQTQPYFALLFGNLIEDEALGEFSGKNSCFVFAASNRTFDTWSSIGDPSSYTWSSSTSSGTEEDGYIWVSSDGRNWAPSLHIAGGYSLKSYLRNVNMRYEDTIKQ